MATNRQEEPIFDYAQPMAPMNPTCPRCTSVYTKLKTLPKVQPGKERWGLFQCTRCGGTFYKGPSWIPANARGNA